ncbi:MAG: hypothetical protein QNK03_10855 [Myxococcota bacterium]|nr:hypothetical protein [Myxococcota bacterium]
MLRVGTWVDLLDLLGQVEHVVGEARAVRLEPGPGAHELVLRQHGAQLRLGGAQARVVLEAAQR